MRILMILPVTNLSDREIERTKQHLAVIGSKDTLLDVVKLNKGPESIEFVRDEFSAAPELLERIMKAEKQGYDAIIDCCFSDPAIHAARECVRIPVVGLMEASIMLASVLGNKFSIITNPLEGIPSVERQARALAKSGTLVSVLAVDIPVLELFEDEQRTKKEFVIEAKRAIDHDHADVIIPGCAHFSKWATQFSRELGVPVVDPEGAALNIAEALVRLKLVHSLKSYPQPPSKEPTLRA
jgi:allantoin racemase